MMGDSDRGGGAGLPFNAAASQEEDGTLIWSASTNATQELLPNAPSRALQRELARDDFVLTAIGRQPGQPTMFLARNEVSTTIQKWGRAPSV